MAAIALVLVALAAAGARAFDVDPNVFNQLKHIRGYVMLFEVHPWLFYQHPLNAIADYITAKVTNHESWLNIGPDTLYRRLFENTCAQLDELYAAHRQYLDALPSVDEDRTKNLLCRLSLIVKDCKLYRQPAFRQALHPHVMEALTEVLMRQLAEENRAMGYAAFLDQDMAQGV